MSAALRQQVAAAARGLGQARLNPGTAGNLSARQEEGFLITPSGVASEDITPEELVFMDMAGQPSGRLVPSSEWRLHRDIYAHRPEVAAVVHCHSPFATALACQRRSIPAFHYMIARFGGADVRCAPYALFGTQALSDAALNALDGRRACLLAHHGMVVVATRASAALAAAIEFEALCEHYWRALQLGEPPLLSEQEMAQVMARFEGYGQPHLLPG